MTAYQAEILHPSDYKTTKWSGGTTTELSISPKESIYADRDFEWRLSSATVDVEESEFTALPDYDRILMTLKGKIRLKHNEGEWIALSEFEPHSFDGKDETVSVGKVTDFNLMTRKGVCFGEAAALCGKEKNADTLETLLEHEPEYYRTIMVYCCNGTLHISSETGEKYELGKGDTLKLTGNLKDAAWSYKADADMEAVLSAVHYC